MLGMLLGNATSGVAVGLSTILDELTSGASTWGSAVGAWSCPQVCVCRTPAGRGRVEVPLAIPPLTPSTNNPA